MAASTATVTSEGKTLYLADDQSKAAWVISTGASSMTKDVISLGRGDQVTTLKNRYTLPAIVLHWVLALLMFTLIGLGWYMVEIPRGTPPRGIFFNLHKSIGVIAGLFILVQLWWRIGHPPPPLPRTLPNWEVKAAKMGHVMLYVCMIVMTLSGYIESNFTKYGIKFFGYPLPPWGWEDKAISAAFVSIHAFTSYILVALIVVHIAAAVKHLLLDKDQVFQRMLPLRLNQSRSVEA